MNYYEYIASPEWRAKAEAAKMRAGYRCQVCNVGASKSTQLNAHHRCYERLGDERPEDIIVLCRDCHALFHQAKKVTRDVLPVNMELGEALRRWGIPHVSEMPEGKDGWDYYEDAKAIIRLGAKLHGNGEESSSRFYDESIRYLVGYLGI